MSVDYTYYCYWKDNDPWALCEEYKLDQCQQCWEYQHGLSKPNYPVPAIPLVVSIKPECVWVYSSYVYGEDRVDYFY